MIFRSRYKFPIKLWKKKFVGETAFILGNGPSLLENDLGLLKNYFTIGTNRAYKIVSPCILMWQDESLYEDCFRDLVTLACAKLTRKEIDKEDLFTHFRIERGGFSFGEDPEVLHGGGSTACLAIQLAVSMGFSKIVLLGCDCSYRGEQTDFYGKNKNHSTNTLANFSAAMEWVSRESPIPIRNCGDAPYWSKISLQAAIDDFEPNKLSRLEWLNRLT
jgi:hypothetical protein